jgi:hypothetical protein
MEREERWRRKKHLAIVIAFVMPVTARIRSICRLTEP